MAHGCLSVFGINTIVGVEHARPILLMCRNYCRLLEGSSMLDPYNEHHPETGYAPVARAAVAVPIVLHIQLNALGANRDLYRRIVEPCPPSVGV